VLVGAAIERLTKEPWEATIVRQLFNPLGMVSAGFGAPIGSNPWGHLPSEEKLEAINPADPRSDNPAALGPAGTVHVTLPDYARFLQLFLTNGGKLLQAETVTKLTTALVREPQAYAMGWGMIDSYPPIGGGRILFHEGSNVAWRAVTVMSLDLSIAAVGVSNDDSPKGQGAAREIAQRLLIAGKELAS
jgi:CubicO group peptidase (beta-lactamase class C family)